MVFQATDGERRHASQVNWLRLLLLELKDDPTNTRLWMYTSGTFDSVGNTTGAFWGWGNLARLSSWNDEVRIRSFRFCFISFCFVSRNDPLSSRDKCSRNSLLTSTQNCSRTLCLTTTPLYNNNKRTQVMHAYMAQLGLAQCPSMKLSDSQTEVCGV
jgi:hypothetical protein